MEIRDLENDRPRGSDCQRPFVGTRPFDVAGAGRSFPRSYSLLSVQSGLLADVNRRGDRVEALVLDADPASPAVLTIGENQIALDGSLSVGAPIDLPPLP